MPASENDPLYRCSECGIYAHKLCYGIKGNPVSWKCNCCYYHQPNPTCCVCHTVRFPAFDDE